MNQTPEQQIETLREHLRAESEEVIRLSAELRRQKEKSGGALTAAEALYAFVVWLSRPESPLAEGHKDFICRASREFANANRIDFPSPSRMERVAIPEMPPLVVKPSRDKIREAVVAAVETVLGTAIIAESVVPHRDMDSSEIVDFICHVDEELGGFVPLGYSPGPNATLDDIVNDLAAL